MSSRSALLGAIVTLFFGCTDCQSCIPAANMPTVIYGELVEAGCLAPDDSGDGITSIYEQHQSDAQPMWLGCLYMGGTVKSCAVPCAGD